LKPRTVHFNRSVRFLAAAIIFVASALQAPAQQTTSATQDSDLADSVRQLREQVQELRSAVSEIRSESAQYRAENQELRNQLENILAKSGAAQTRPAENPSAAQNNAEAQNNNNVSSAPTEQRVSSLEETTQVMQSELSTLYQTKVESASKYRVRLSGLVLLNLFHNRGEVDNFDVPTYASSTGPYGVTPGFGATLRQSELGLEVFGPELAGAKTRGEVQFDFGGGFPAGALDGINTGIVRLRTANMRLDWENTSLVVGQDSLFISPNSPTSFASLLVPSLGYSGNLWAWTPQLRLEHRFELNGDQYISMQGGILDNLTGEPSDGSHRLPQAGEASGLPAYAARTAWTKNMNGKPLTLGASGYYSRQNWGPGWTTNGWAAIGDWRIPIYSRFEFSGEFYRGKAVGGLGGGIGQSVLFESNPLSPGPGFRPLNSAGGWSQLKFTANSRLEFNGAFGVDNPFARDIHAISSPVGVYPSVLTANRSELLNFIYRPRSDLLFSGEYRHLRTSQIGNYYSADHVNLMMGVLF